MADDQGQVLIPITVARGPVFIKAVDMYSLAYDIIDFINDHNLATTLMT